MRFRLAAALAALVIAVPAMAQQERPQAFARVLDCRTVADPGERLACYDRQVEAMAQAEAADDLVVVDRQQIRETRRSLFGLALPSLGIFGSDDRDEDDEEANRISTTVRAARQDAYGKYLMMLEDGAVWRQIDDRQLPAPPRPGSTIEIRKAAMGSYMANVNGQSAIRVRRER